MVDACPPPPLPGLALRIWRCAGPVVTVCLSFLCYQATAPCHAAERPEANIPSDVPLAISFDNLQAASQAWQKTGWGKLVGGPTFLPLRQELETRDQPAPLNLRPWFGFDWAELAVVGQPASLLVVASAPGRAGVAWVFPQSQDASGTTKLLADAQKYWQAHGFTASKETQGTASLTVFKAKAGSKDSRSPTFFAAGKLVGVADQREVAVSLVARWTKGRLEALDEDADYQLAVKEGKGGSSLAEIRWWVRPLELWDLLRSKDATARKRDWLAIIKRQGGHGLRAIGGRVIWPTNGECDAELRGTVFMERPLTKAARMMDLIPGPAAAVPSWVDAQTSSLAAWRWNVPVAMSAFGQIFDEVNEEGENGEGLFEELLDGLRDDPEGPQVDLRKDVFAFLGPDVQEITDNRAERTRENPEGARSLVIIQCREPQRVRKTLERFYEGDELVSKERLAGQPAWTIGPGRSLLVEGESDSLVNIRAVTVTASEVIFASDPEVLRERLEKKPATTNSDGRLAAWEKWRKSAEDSQTCFRSLVRVNAWWEGSYQTIRSGERNPDESFHTAGLRFLLLGQDAPADFPVQKMPAWNDIQGSLSTLGTLLRQTDGGFQATAGLFRSVATGK